MPYRRRSGRVGRLNRFACHASQGPIKSIPDHDPQANALDSKRAAMDRWEAATEREPKETWAR